MDLDLHTLYEVECYRDGSIIWNEVFPNTVTMVGKTLVLDSIFRLGIAVTTWYVGLVNNASFIAHQVSDTMSAHSGWVEGVPYSQATRVAFVPGAAAAGTISNEASRAVFSINAAQTIQGCFLTTVSTKSGTTGTLYGIGDFIVPRAVLIGDVLNLKITLTA